MLNTPGQPVSFRRYVMALLGQPNLSLTLGAFVVGLLGNTLASLLGGWQVGGIPGNLIIVLVLLVIVLLIYFYSRQLRPKVEIEECQPEGKAGLILLISPLNPILSGTPSPEEVQRRRLEVREAARRLVEVDELLLTPDDFAPLVSTNLEPALRALEFHYRAGTLRDCWMISTSDVKREDGELLKGSSAICPLLQRWFNTLHPRPNVQFHYKGYEAAPRAYGEIWRKVDGIFRTSPLKPSQIICDITGGTKLMSIGASLACIADERNMQYMASDRDWRGEPIERGTLAPVLVDVTPYLSLPSQGD